MDVRYPRSFDIVRLQATGEPPHLAAAEAADDYAAGHGLTVVPAEVSELGLPRWSLQIGPAYGRGQRFTVTFYGEFGTPLRDVVWQRYGNELLREQTVDLFYPEGDPCGRVPWIGIPYVDRRYSEAGVATVTYAPPGFVSGREKPKKAKRDKTQNWGDHDQRDDVRNGPTHTVAGVEVPHLPVPAFGEWRAVVEASAPDDLVRFGPGAEAAAEAYAYARP